MPSLRAVVLVILSLASVVCTHSACAQRGRGGNPGMAAPVPAAAHSGFSPVPHPGFASAGTRIGPAASATRSGYASVPSTGATANRGWSAGRESYFPAPGITSTRPVYFENGIRREGPPEHRGERAHAGYGVPAYGFVNLGYPGYPGFGYDGFDLPNLEEAGYAQVPESLVTPQTGTANAADERAFYSQPGEAAPAPYLAAAEPAAQSPVAAPAPPPEEEEVTIIFKDGRPAERIHNYALTRTTLYVTTGRVRTIPVEQIDLAATAKLNEKAGVEFQLPSNK